MADSTTLELVKKYLNALITAGIPVTKAILFGSYANGNQSAQSDIDLLLVSPAFDEERNRYVGRIWALTKVVDYKIEPVVVGEHRFEEDDTSPLLEVIRREGIEVAF